ncbi:MAG TPA: hypothetical protein VGR16_11000 [Thermomicrobiales bacterium]|nr:hypothetical protein [Thermomicrobiales bacterium]
MATRTTAPASATKTCQTAAEQEEEEWRAQANASLVALLRSWRADEEEPADEQRQALVRLMHALDEDRASDRRLFPGP